jgi:hypothetical protein
MRKTLEPHKKEADPDLTKLDLIKNVRFDRLDKTQTQNYLCYHLVRNGYEIIRINICFHSHNSQQ